MVMKENQPHEIRLEDYRVPNYLIDSTHLHFELGEAATLVKSTLQMRRNPDADATDETPLVLDGVDLVLRRLAIDGSNLDESAYSVDEESLTIHQVPSNFELECVTLIKPQDNKSLEGLYRSNTMYCTQCEAEGFRKITYYLDRPDVMSVFTTTIVADADAFPILLSNGNDVDRGENDTGRHWVTWHDPFKKPAYLFALVAGDLNCIESYFTTMRGREITLQIFVEPENIDKVDHAMCSLKKSMAWDEKMYGREYDLDKFMIVAVSDFNMGAMENKGLNIFNSSCVLANSESQTDAAFQRVEGVVAHEYFHNWSGNRVTCRDWFQLSLKEGFTVFRDQEFSADMGSRTVKRIDDVAMLRTIQFAEDSSPMAHPVRPDAYVEISNFYTVTIYEKGAELIRMMHTLLGPALFRAGSDFYFERHDGQAVTTEDFVKAMEDASGVDLNQFRLWYSQAGTPEITVQDEYNETDGSYTLTVFQHTPSTPNQQDKQPLHIPFELGLLSKDGQQLASEVLEITEQKQSFTFEGLGQKPVPSLFRGFSAPVKISYPYQRADLQVLMRHDQDGFNRWNAGQTLALDMLTDNIKAHQQGIALTFDHQLADVFRDLLADETLDQAMLARMLMLPSEQYLAELAEEIDIDAIHVARNFIEGELATALHDELLATYQDNQIDGPYSAHSEAMALRALKNIALHYLMKSGNPGMLNLCQTQLSQANNMTDVSAALVALVNSDHQQEKAAALADFYQQWQHDPLVVDQWFAIQATCSHSDTFEQVKKLQQHPAFSITNPNKVRALIGGFSVRNLVNFHRADGAGYQFLADTIVQLDTLNPQIAARLMTPFVNWRKFTSDRQTLMHTQLERIHNQQTLSKDVYEVVVKTLA